MLLHMLLHSSVCFLLPLLYLLYAVFSTNFAPAHTITYYFLLPLSRVFSSHPLLSFLLTLLKTVASSHLCSILQVYFSPVPVSTAVHSACHPYPPLTRSLFALP